jgi:hypothetical protein
LGTIRRDEERSPSEAVEKRPAKCAEQEFFTEAQRDELDNEQTEMLCPSLAASSLVRAGSVKVTLISLTIAYEVRLRHLLNSRYLRPQCSPRLEAIDGAQISSIGRYRNCDDPSGCCGSRRRRAPHPEQPEWVFKLWFVTFMALISWGTALILRPLVQSFLSNTLDRH